MAQNVELCVFDPAIVETARRREFLIEERRKTLIRIRLGVVVRLHAVRIRICKRIAVYREEELRLGVFQTDIHTRLQFPR